MMSIQKRLMISIQHFRVFGTILLQKENAQMKTIDRSNMLLIVSILGQSFLALRFTKLSRNRE